MTHPAQQDSCQVNANISADLERGEQSVREIALSSATAAADTNNQCQGECIVDGESCAEKKVAKELETISSGRRRRRPLCALGTTLTFLGLLELLRPRSPEWSLTKMNIDTTLFAGVMMGAGGTGAPLNLTADVSFFNPNLLGCTIEPGSFVVRLGDDEIATGTTSGGSVGARSSANVHADVSMALDSAMSKKILDELKSNNFKLKVTADVVNPAKVLGFIRVKAYVTCDIVSDAMKVMTAPEDNIVEKHCRYSYRL